MTANTDNEELANTTNQTSLKPSLVEDVVENNDKPKTIIVLPLSEQPFFPAQTQPLLMNELPWMESIKQIGDEDEHIVGLFFIDSPNHQATDNIKTADFTKVGTLAKMRHPSLHDHKIQFIAEGIQRIKIKKWLTRKAPFRVEIEYLDDVLGGNKKTLKAYAMSIISVIKQLVDINPVLSEELKYFLDRFNASDPALLSDFATNMVNASPQEMQQILTEHNVKKRMVKILALLQKSLEIAKIQSKIHREVNHKMDKQQREFFLREQLKTIKQELGIAKDDVSLELEKFTLKLKNLKLPENAKQTIDEAMDKLQSLASGSPEYTVTRNHLEWLTDLPWGVFSKDRLNLNQAKKSLNQKHYGMLEVKDRILEFIAVGKLKGEIGGSIILLVGAPGVGKTSIGIAIAEALNRKIFRFSVGGMRDEAEIKGHRRTYIGAIPGKIINAFKQTQTQNPVILLDEVDKIGSSYAGDPASALLEVLDPEQNTNFIDHYLDTSFDLSKALFICTANNLYNIPEPLLDRMEIIEVSGYITEEKIEIAKQYLIPKQLAKNGLTAQQLKFSYSAIRKMIEDFAREAGVRSLEKIIKKVCRKVAVKLAYNQNITINLSLNNLADFLGKPIFDDDALLSKVGTTTGLAWTNVGGVTLTIESSLVHTKNRGFKLTGQLGDVMQESAEIAYSYICSNLKKYQINNDFFDQSLIHIHVPAGATPKDGPSAGITIATALLSLAKNKKINRKLAMTGEITLTGKVLPIGGLREKIIAAKRAKIYELVLPFANEYDFNELPKYITKGIKAHFVKDFAAVSKIAFAI